MDYKYNSSKYSQKVNSKQVILLEKTTKTINLADLEMQIKFQKPQDWNKRTIQY